ncbi:MAG: aminopeptidase, partial [Alistipes sp.]|nr:aminopeptidase [Alistipes sp.]
MKKILLTAALLCACVGASAQYKYEFTDVKVNAATPVKNQASTGTCWCFATVSFLESELLRMGKGEYDLSEMFVVRNNYIRRMNDNYLRRGRGNVSQGSIAHMVTWVMDNVGLMPEEVYDGINYDSATHNHGELAKWVKTVSDAAVEMKTPLKPEIVNGVMDAYLGEVPATFTYKGKEYNAASFAESLGLKAEDYVELTSFSHHPLYELVPVEIPDNWDHAMMYNLPLDEFMQVIDHAVNAGYTVTWDGDVSEPGYAFQHYVAVNTDE